jgi:hypothetical protein
MNALFKTITEDEKPAFRQWARDNYKPFDPIPPIWHPTTQTECRKINEEIKTAIEQQWGENFLENAKDQMESIWQKLEEEKNQ